MFFLDGHCRVNKGWLEGLLARYDAGVREDVVNGHKNIIVPAIDNIDGVSFEFDNTPQAKMMFGWDFDFSWFDTAAQDIDGERDDEVPILSGGILLMSKRWWVEGGGYDAGMLQWGGENLEQSLRTWMCGGKIVVERDVVVGHVFTRPLLGQKADSGIVRMNQARAALVYLDDSFRNFRRQVLDMDSVLAGISQREQKLREGSLTERFALRAGMGCAPFSQFQKHFSSVFEQRLLLEERVHHIRDHISGLCLQANAPDSEPNERISTWTNITWEPCQQAVTEQRWSVVNVGEAHGGQIANAASYLCLTAVDDRFVLERCDIFSPRRVSFRNGKFALPSDERVVANVSRYQNFEFEKFSWLW